MNVYFRKRVGDFMWINLYNFFKILMRKLSDDQIE